MTLAGLVFSVRSLCAERTIVIRVAVIAEPPCLFWFEDLVGHGYVFARGVRRDYKRRTGSGEQSC
jgi:hypothetical protein